MIDSVLVLIRGNLLLWTNPQHNAWPE